MFEFTTQSIYNEIVVSNEQDVDKSKINVYVGEDGGKPQVRIGNTRFNDNNIESLYIKYPTEGYKTSVTFDMAKIVAKASEEDVTGRIVLYVGLSMNCQDSFYANDFVYKGKPLFIEFNVKKGDTAANVAKTVKAVAKKYMLLTALEKILDLEVDGQGNVTITGTNDYQLLKKAVLQWFNPEADTVDCCTYAGDYEDLQIGIPSIYLIENGNLTLPGQGGKGKYIPEGATNAEDAINIDEPYVAIYPGIEAFGDYNWMIHNLRLPTLANTNFWAPTKMEMPIPGLVYTQFTVKMVTPNRDGIAGEAVGQRVTSVTTHVFYVAGDANDENTPAGKLKKLLTETLQLKDTKDALLVAITDADDTLNNPFTGDVYPQKQSEGGGGNDDNP